MPLPPRPCAARLRADFYAVLGDAHLRRGQRDAARGRRSARAARKPGRHGPPRAESCTGGLVSAALTDVPRRERGVSGFGACTYSNETEDNARWAFRPKRCGGMAPSQAQRRPPEVAQGVRRAAGADFGIGITGIAGPGGGTKRKAGGACILAAACEIRCMLQKLLMEDRTRGAVRRFSAKCALEMLRRLALSLPQPGCEAFAPGTPAHLGGAQAPRDA